MKRLSLSLALLALGAAAEVKLPPYTREVLPNGAVVLLMPRTGVPLVHFRILVKGGVESEPAHLAGVANATAQLLRRGTSKRSADRFSEELDSLGGSFSAGLEDMLGDATEISAEFLKKDFGQGLDLLADAVLRPAFPEDEVRHEVARLADASKALKDNPQPAIYNYFLRAFYGAGHPYGNPADEGSILRIGRKDIVEYHRKLYCGRNLIVAVTGDFDASAGKAKLASTFGAAPAGEAYPYAVVPELKRRGMLLLVDKPDATQTYFMIAQPGIRRASPDRTKLELVNTLFGGRFTSMLNDALRVNSGLTYGAGSMLQQARIPGAIAITTYTKAESTTRAIDLALEILKRLHDNGITAVQLASAKAYLKGTFPMRRLETIDQLADTLTGMELYGLSRDEVDGFNARVDAITLDEANAVARKYYRPDDLTLVLLGPAGKIREAVRKYDPRPAELSIKSAGWGL
jgi:zinc protease